jgi:hypothetical protein
MRIAQFIAILIFAILIGVHLHSIVGEVNKLISRIVELEFTATCTDIALLVPVTSYLSILN